MEVPVFNEISKPTRHNFLVGIYIIDWVPKALSMSWFLNIDLVQVGNEENDHGAILETRTDNIFIARVSVFNYNIH